MSPSKHSRHSPCPPPNTCQLHLCLPGFTDGLKFWDLDTRHILLAGVHLEGGPVDVVKHGVLDAVAARVPAQAGATAEKTREGR